MPRKDYSEDILIQQPTAELLEPELKWDSVFAYDTDPRIGKVILDDLPD